MRQIKHALRCLSIALVLVATFVTLMPAEQASARISAQQLEAACIAEGGEFNQAYRWDYLTGEFFHYYSCDLPDGRHLACEVEFTYGSHRCHYFDGSNFEPIPLPLPLDDLPPGFSQPADGQLADENGPIGPAPAGHSPAGGDSHSGFETKMAGQ